jgi:methionine sulfoxide reductase heme-binding subunit
MILLATGPNPLWFVARATGVVSLVLLTAVVVLGIGTTGRWSSNMWPRSLFAGIHRNLSLLSVVFVGVHIAASILDPYAGILWRDALVPYGATYRPVWLGLGTLTIEVAAALIITSLLRRFIPWGVWRAIHWTAYGLWPLALLHSLGTGSDSRAWWALGIEASCTAAVVAVAIHRIRLAELGWLRRRTMTLAAVGGAALLALWTLNGPMQLDWALRAGTPVPVSAPKAWVPPKPTPLAVAATGSLVTAYGKTGMYLVAAKDPSISVAIVPTIDGGHQLTLEWYGQPVCQAPATVGTTSITAACTGLVITVTIGKKSDGSLVGMIKTSAPLR